MNKRGIAALAAILLAAGGVFMLLNYASAANDRAYDGAALQKVLRVKTPIAANTKAGDLAGKVELVKLPRSAIAEGAISDLHEIAGLAANTGLEPGEQVLKSRFVEKALPVTGKSKSAVPVGMQEVSIPLDVARAVGGKLEPGDIVGVIASFATKDGEGTTQLILNRVRVTHVSQGVDKKTAQAGSTQMVTLAVKTHSAGKIINAAEFGKVWLSKQNSHTANGNGGRITRVDVS